MNIKRFIDELDAIKAMPRSEQFTLIESAIRDSSFRWKYRVLEFFAPLVCVFITVSSSIYFWTFTWIGAFTATILGLLIARVLVIELHTNWIVKALPNVMTKKSA